MTVIAICFHNAVEINRESNTVLDIDYEKTEMRLWSMSLTLEGRRFNPLHRNFISFSIRRTF